MGDKVAMDDVARRLDAAADQLAEMRADLARQEFAPGTHGRQAREATAALHTAWAGHLEHIARLTTGLTALSTSVRLATTHYRTADGEPS